MGYPCSHRYSFAMGVLGLLGSRVPASLRLFLLTVAIVDDIGAVLVLRFFTPTIKMFWLLASLIVFGVLMLLNRGRISSFLPFAIIAILLWFCVLNTGVHATIAGVIAALLSP